MLSNIFTVFPRAVYADITLFVSAQPYNDNILHDDIAHSLHDIHLERMKTNFWFWVVKISQDCLQTYEQKKSDITTCYLIALPIIREWTKIVSQVLTWDQNITRLESGEVKELAITLKTTLKPSTETDTCSTLERKRSIEG